MLNENERIEKIAREMCHLSDECKTCQICSEKYPIEESELCYYQCIAKKIKTHNYRTASEVVDEFAAGLKNFLHDAPVVYQAWFGRKIDNFADRFKKKYTEGENERE